MINTILENGDGKPENENIVQFGARNRSGHLDIVGLLTQVAETHDLQSVQSIQLKVMTKDLPLHSLHMYLPGLKELDLESSNVNSLRELGSELKSLQVLRLGRCRLDSLDGIIAFKHLKEFSAPNNYITDLGLAGQLSHIIYFDISRNYIEHWCNLSFFKGASTLEELHFHGNPGSKLENYRSFVEELLPQLVVLDGVAIVSKKIPMTHDLCGNLAAALAHNKKRQKNEIVPDANKAPKSEKLSDHEMMLRAAIAWKEGYDGYLKKKQ